MSWRKKLLKVTLGKEPADLVIQNGKLVNVNTREIYPSGIAVSGDRIAAIGDVSYAIGKDTKILDAEGKFLVPGLIEGHMHTESSLVTLTELSKVLLPRGVTTVLYAHEMANILGLKGMEVIREESLQVPLKVLFQTPTSVPWSDGLEMPAAKLSVDEVKQMLDWKESVSLGESDYFDVIRLNEELLAKLDHASALGKPVNGHVEVESEKILMAAAAVFHNDHESYTADEVLRKLRLGLGVILRDFCIPYIASAVTENEIDTQNIMLCIDDKLINTLDQEGGLDQTVRLAISHGIDPLVAIQMATLNTAKHYRLDHNIGSLSPGRICDVIITESLESLNPAHVVANGKPVGKNGEFLLDLPKFVYPTWTKKTMKVKENLGLDDFQIKFEIQEGEVELNILKMANWGLSKELVTQKFPVSGGQIHPDTNGQYNLIAIVERHGGDGKVNLGLTEGFFNLARGAVGSSVGHDCYNMTVLGTNSEDMEICAKAIVDANGGFAAVLDGEIIAQVPLEIAGIVSQLPYEEVVEQMNNFERVIQSKLGFPEASFIIFNFIVLACSPFKAAINTRGLIDVENQCIVPFVLSETSG